MWVAPAGRQEAGLQHPVDDEPLECEWGQGVRGVGSADRRGAVLRARPEERRGHWAEPPAPPRPDAARRYIKNDIL